MNLSKLGQDLEVAIQSLMKEVEDDGGLLSGSVTLKVCGQLSLLADEALSSRIELEGTRDLDVTRNGLGRVLYGKVC